MDRSRAVLYAAAAVSLVVSVFAVGMAVTSSEDGGGAAPPESSAAPPGTAASVTDTGATSAPAAAATARVDIEIADFTFSPAEAVVAVGNEVVWTNNDGFDHTIFADGEAFPGSPTLGQGDTYSFVFTEPGTYQYICSIHTNMTGTIVVEA